MPMGIVKETKSGYVKVSFPEYNYISDWIQVVSLLAGANKSVFNIDKETQVFILQERDRYGEISSQICIGATNNNVNIPPFKDQNKEGFLFEEKKTMVLGSEETSAVRYKELLTKLNTIQGNLNAFKTLYNTHVHVTIGIAVIDTPTTMLTKLDTETFTDIESKQVKLR